MDYKEKYEQALEVAKETYDTQPMYREWLEKMFPELLESEDEKVRKELIKETKGSEVRLFETVTNDEFVAWLENIPYTIDHEKREGFHLGYRAGFEKQGEQKPILDIEIPFGAKDSELQEVSYHIPEGFHAEIEGDKVTIKKGEQKSVDVRTIGYWHVEDVEQKPAWSEEEERYICQLESMVKERWALAEKAQDEEVIKNMSNLAFFLKTLNPNKKPADEDMKTLLRTEYEKGRADAIAEIQNRWKPSKRQLVCLQNTIEHYNLMGSPATTLNEILKQLKKLKEEQA